MVITKEGRGRPSRESILAAVDQELVELSAIGGLPKPAEAEAIWEDIWYEEAHHSTAIEGNTLILKEVKELLAAGRAVGDKEMAQYLEVLGYGEAAKWVYQQAVDPGEWASEQSLNITELREIHTLVVEPLWRHYPPDDLLPGEGPGGFRQHDIAAFPGGMKPPSLTDVPAHVADWLAFVNTGPADGEHRLTFLAETHYRFERIHPFRDGNGRTGRLVLNLLLVRQGFPPAIIFKRDRERYLRALRRADQEDLGALTEVVARAVKDSLDRFVLPGLAGPQRLLPLSALATKQVSALALRYAAERNRLRAQRIDGRWYSTKQWVDAYSKSRRRGRPPTVRTAG